ncbi:MAG: pyridoxal-phosphate dependent enzyme [Bacteroidetes bacterium]|nr:pyridoxal-phosphate dependent enzyme [Bacteroidota bacterium]
MALEISLNDIRSAHAEIKDRVHYTPVHSSTQLSDRSGIELFFKCENLQKTGSFKVRGVLNKIAHLSEDARSKGLVSISAGNHAQAIAWAATAAGIQCTVVMPDTASKTKIEATKEYGAEVVQPGDVFAAFEKMQQIEREEGKTLVHPFEDKYIIAGHGTVGLEVLEQLDNIDAVVIGIGGGALSSGIAIAIKEQNPKIKVYGVEPEGANAMQQSLAAGKPIQLDKVNTIADGLAPPMAGEVPFTIIKNYLDDVVTVSDHEIGSAIKDLLTRTKLLVEPAGAAATAAILSKKISFSKGQRVVSILSGGNIDLDRLSDIFNENES